jgi:hypothetical protein
MKEVVNLYGTVKHYPLACPGPWDGSARITNLTLLKEFD